MIVITVCNFQYAFVDDDFCTFVFQGSFAIMSSVKVAVRVRPFNNRELQRDCTCIIDMSEKMTSIYFYIYIYIRETR